LKKIAEHVLSRHLSLSKENIVVVVDQLDFSLAHGAVGKPSYLASFFFTPYTYEERYLNNQFG